MTTYTHSFNVSFPISFNSTFRDFDEAFDDWAESFTSDEDLRKALLDCQDDLGALCSSVDWWGTRMDKDSQELDENVTEL